MVPQKSGSLHEVKEEGYYYTWDWNELEDLVSEGRLAPEERRSLQAFYHLTREGNFEGRNILNLDRALSADQKEKTGLKRALEKLLAERSRRPRPHLDSKVLVSWNGLMIGAFAQAARVLGKKIYLSAAEKAAAFILANLVDPVTGRLYRRWIEGEAKFSACSEDYSSLIYGLIQLYLVKGEKRWLEQAIHLQEKLDGDYGDPVQGGYFTDDGKDASVVLRLRESYDGVTPTSSSLSVCNLLRMSELTGDFHFRQKALQIIEAHLSALTQHPLSLSQMVSGCCELLEPKCMDLNLGCQSEVCEF